MRIPRETLGTLLKWTFWERQYLKKPGSNRVKDSRHSFYNGRLLTVSLGLPNALRFSKKIIVFNFPILWLMAESLKDASWIRHLVLLLEEVQLFYYSEKEKKSPYWEERTMWSKNKNILANISHRSLDTALIKIWERKTIFFAFYCFIYRMAPQNVN